MEMAILLGSCLEISAFLISLFCSIFSAAFCLLRLQNSVCPLWIEEREMICSFETFLFPLISTFETLLNRRLQVNDDQHHREKEQNKGDQPAVCLLLSLFFNFGNTFFYIHYFFFINTGFHVGSPQVNKADKKTFICLFLFEKRRAFRHMKARGQAKKLPFSETNDILGCRLLVCFIHYIIRRSEVERPFTVFLR